MKYIIIILIISFISIQCNSQVLGGSINSNYKLDDQAIGYSININYKFDLFGDFRINLGMGQSLSSSKRPQEIHGYSTGIRSSGQIDPYGINFFYRESDFPGVSLPIRDNKYFKFDFTLAAQDLIDYGELDINPGLVLSFKDHKEIERYIIAERIEFIFPPNFISYDQLIPVYNFSSYFDIGAMIQFEYSVFQLDTINIGVDSRLMYYPFSFDYSIQLGFMIQLNVNK